MSLPSVDTVVSFAGGAVSGSATVVHVAEHHRGTVVLTDRTPCHPVDPRWPDQGPDRGELHFGGGSVQLIDAVIGATDGVILAVGDEVTARRGDPGWAFVVAHLISGQERPPAEGEEVVVAVDAGYRLRLSAGHTGCHVAALALNAALAGRWRKAVTTDGLGNPDFDQLAIVSSRIRPDGAVDMYRMGRTLRKKGFDAEGLVSALPEIQAVVDQQLARWVAAGPAVEVVSHGPLLTDLREWACYLPEGNVRIPCGGTHLRSLTEVVAITGVLQADPSAGELTMTTTVQRVE